MLSRSPSVEITCARHDDSTSNLKRHTEKCSPATTSKSSISAFAYGSTYSPAKLRMKLALWVTRRHRPFSIVEDPELIEIFLDLNNKAIMPSRQTLARDVQDIFQISRKHISKTLQVCDTVFLVHLLIPDFRLLMERFILLLMAGPLLSSTLSLGLWSNGYKIRSCDPSFLTLSGLSHYI